MAKCPQCGNEVGYFKRDLITGVCENCRKVGARPATLGCGTLVLIAIIVAMFSKSGVDNVERRMVRLEASIHSLQTQLKEQTEEIRALRRAIESTKK